MATIEGLDADRTYYVRTDGNDANDGLGDGSMGAFATWQKAADTAAGLFFNNKRVTLKAGGSGLREFYCASGADVAHVKPWLGGGNLRLEGDLTTPDNVRFFSSGGGNGVRVRPPFSSGAPGQPTGGNVSVQGFRLEAPGGYLVRNAGIGNVDVNACILGACAVGCATEWPGATLRTAALTIVGDMERVIDADAGFVYLLAGLIKIIGARTVSDFVRARNGGYLVSDATFDLTAGSITGRRYNAYQNAFISSQGRGADYFPGTVAGVTSDGGGYD